MKTFQELELEQLFDVLQLRVDVFVVEQKCAYRELDEYDRHTNTGHLSGRNELGQLIAYSRLLPPRLRYPEVNLGKVVVKAESRNQGVGHQLMKNSLQEISSCWSNIAIKVSAQDYLQKFYAQYGFIRISDVYLEDGIPHVEMVKEA